MAATARRGSLARFQPDCPRLRRIPMQGRRVVSPTQARNSSTSGMSANAPADVDCRGPKLPLERRSTEQKWSKTKVKRHGRRNPLFVQNDKWQTVRPPHEGLGPSARQGRKPSRCRQDRAIHCGSGCLGLQRLLVVDGSFNTYTSFVTASAVLNPTMHMQGLTSGGFEFGDGANRRLLAAPAATVELDMGGHSWEAKFDCST